MKQVTWAVLMTVATASCGTPEPVVTKIWTRDTAGRATTAAVFMTIESRRADRLVSASADVANQTDLMTMESANGAMSMRYVQGIELPRATAVRLDPSGLHVWLEGLRQPLRAGATFPMTLTFQKAGKRTVEVKVIGISARPPS